MVVMQHDTSSSDEAREMLSLTKDSCNDYLEKFFESQIARAELAGSRYRELWERMRTLTMSGGKRLRPYVVGLGYRIAGGDASDHEIIQAAAAHELLHQALLMHDDIIDRDFSRYGRPNIAAIYRDDYLGSSQGLVSDQATHLAYGAALLGGDVLIAAAQRLIWTSEFDPRLVARAAEVFDDGIFGVAGGQMIDMESVLRSPQEVDTMNLTRLKTATYSFVSPLCCGAVLAGADDDMVGKLRDIGYDLGVGFQLSDDLLGMFGDEQTTGKSNSSDIREGKRTYLLQKGLELADSDQRKVLDEVIGLQDATDRQLQMVRDVLELCGARSRVEQRIESLFASADQVLSTMELPDQIYEEVSGFCRLLRERRS